MRKRQKAVINYIIFRVVFLPIWVAKRIIKNLKSSFREIDLTTSDIDQINSLSGPEFEEFLAAMFRKKGFKVEMTPITGDFGADLILEGDGYRTAVQAKRYSNLAGLDAVQEVLGARDYYKADKLMVITNNYFSNAAKKQAESSNVILWDRGNLIQEILDVPDKDTSWSEYLVAFIKKSLTDYKLVAGLVAVIFLYLPATTYVLHSLNSPNSKTVLVHDSTQYQNSDLTTQETPTPKSIEISTTQYSNTLEEVNRRLSLSRTRPGYLLYRNSLFGYSIQFPEEFSLEGPPEYGCGYTFVSRDSRAKLTVFGVNNTGYTTSELYDKVIQDANGELGYRVLKRTWFVVTQSYDGITQYRKSIVGNGSENTFIFTFPSDQKPYYDRIITNMEKSFTHGNTESSH